MFDQIGVEPPVELLQRLQDLDAHRHQVTLFIEFVCAINILYFDHNSSRELILFRGRRTSGFLLINNAIFRFYVHGKVVKKSFDWQMPIF